MTNDKFYCSLYESESINDIDGRVKAFTNRGLAAFKKGDLEASVCDFDESLRQQPGNFKALFHRISVRERLQVDLFSFLFHADFPIPPSSLLKFTSEY